MKTSLKWTTVVAVACLAAATVAAQQPAPSAPPQSSFAAGAASAPLTAPIPIDPQITTGQFAERPSLLHPHQQEAGEARRAAPRGQCRLDSRGSRSVRAGAFRRAHGLQRHEALPEAGDGQVPRIDRHAVRPERERVHQLRRNGLHARGARPTSRTCSTRRFSSSRTGRTTSRSTTPRSTRNAASSPKSGGCAAAPARACRTSSFRSCSRDRATPSGCQSATWKSSRASSTSA